jgi:outer membrane lipoprotein LolB
VHRTRLPLAATLLALLLSACAGQVARPVIESSWEEHRDRLQALTHWDAIGKLALRTSELAESASLEWRQQGPSTTLQLSGPLGVNATTVYSDGASLVIRQGEDTHTLDLSDPLEFERRTGWDLPLQALPHWLKGVPAPDLAVQYLEVGQDPTLLQTLQQDDWEVRYQQYARFELFMLPTRLTIQRASTTLRVIIRDWELPPS